MITTRSLAVVDMPPDACMKVIARGRHASVRITFSFPTFDALNGGESPRAIGFIYGMGKLEWLGYRLIEFA